jgi:hypothetical protein
LARPSPPPPFWSRQVGATTTGYLRISIACELVGAGAADDDGLTAVSGLTGLQSAEGEVGEQDLSGEGLGFGVWVLEFRG